MANKSIREFQRSIGADGLAIVSLARTGSNHYKAVIEAADKRRMTYILAASNSDGRAAKNRLADIKRFFNN
jgi:hypothetical protein